METATDLIKQSAEITAMAESLKALGQKEEDAYKAAWIIVTGRPMPGSEQIPLPAPNNNALYAVLGIGVVIVLILAMKGKY